MRRIKSNSNPKDSSFFIHSKNGMNYNNCRVLYPGSHDNANYIPSYKNSSVFIIKSNVNINPRALKKNVTTISDKSCYYHPPNIITWWFASFNRIYVKVYLTLLPDIPKIFGIGINNGIRKIIKTIFLLTYFF